MGEDKILNRFEIDKKIMTDLGNIRNQEDLSKLQKWAKKAKKQKVVENTVTSFKKISYSYTRPIRSHGSGRKMYDKVENVEFTSFIFLGLEIIIERDKNSKYQFPETDFNSNKIWIDRKIKWGGTEYFPKEAIIEYFGINFLDLFFAYLNEKKFYILYVEARTNALKYYLCNSDENAKKLLHGRRLNMFDTCNNPVVKISHQNALYLADYIKTKGYYDFIDKVAVNDFFDAL